MEKEYANKLTSDVKENSFNKIKNEEYVKARLRKGEITLDKYLDVVRNNLNCVKAALEGSTVNFVYIPNDIKRMKWVANAYYTGYIKDQEREAEIEEQEMLKYQEFESYYPEYLDIEYESDQAWREYREEDRIQEEIDESWNQLDREDYFNQTNYPEYVLVQNAVYEAKQNNENVLDAIIDVVSNLNDEEYYNLKDSLTNEFNSIASEFMNLNNYNYKYPWEIDDIINTCRKENIRTRY